MSKISVRQNETFQLPITVDDETAETVTLKVWGDTEEINETASFVDGEATIDVGIVTAPVGVYSYSITVSYTDDVVDILPDVSNCSDCSFPEFEVCSGGLEEES